MQIINEVQLDFSDVLMKPKRSTIVSRKDANIIREYKYKWNAPTNYGTGIFNANMDTVGTFAVARKMLENNLFCTLHKYYTAEQIIKFYEEGLQIISVSNSSSVYKYDMTKCFISIGLKKEELDKIEAVIRYFKNKNVYFPPLSICIDVPNGYIPPVKALIQTLRDKYKDINIMVGNVVTGDITEDLILSGANIVKVGIGPGSACRTRLQTGVGRPQLSTIIECADAAHGVGGMICADGGITCAGDLCKAFGAGADFVMIGGLYAGTTEAEGKIIERVYQTNQVIYDESENHERLGKLETKKQYKLFYGMSSLYNQNKNHNGMPKYRASEGRVVEVPYVGSIDSVNEELLGGLRSCMTYIGAKRLKDIPKCTTFYRVNNQLNKIFERYEKE